MSLNTYSMLFMFCDIYNHKINNATSSLNFWVELRATGQWLYEVRQWDHDILLWAIDVTEHTGCLEKSFTNWEIFSLEILAFCYRGSRGRPPKHFCPPLKGFCPPKNFWKLPLDFLVVKKILQTPCLMWSKCMFSSLNCYDRNWSKRLIVISTTMSRTTRPWHSG